MPAASSHRRTAPPATQSLWRRAKLRSPLLLPPCFTDAAPNLSGLTKSAQSARFATGDPSSPQHPHAVDATTIFAVDPEISSALASLPCSAPVPPFVVISPSPASKEIKKKHWRDEEEK
ncbi:hypothetical protein M0R45_036203 [Rubus argutus]|uniref:Uncharacterized protein n=1 Tax=Rubus argutus TaxID=59490 RepID=A0AAW1VX58_RUBAR